MLTGGAREYYAREISNRKFQSPVIAYIKAKPINPNLTSQSPVCSCSPFVGKVLCTIGLALAQLPGAVICLLALSMWHMICRCCQ